MQPIPTDTQAPRRGRGRAAFFLLALTLVAGLTGALVTHAFSEGMGPIPAHWRHGGFMERSFDPARAAERLDRMVRHLAVEVDASAEQQEKLRAVARAAVKELLPMRDKMREARERARELLTQTTIDRAAIEKLRADHLALIDNVSRRVVQAVADAAEILTPEQRRKLSERFPAGGGFWRGWHRG
ncbi:MAG TPA: Spy/CpxP family protein refolding chaperone [Xanthobacteraceae bacterium]|nr:Spy/CpxP family protein refolding chaperone [Xanthobacteraceae bacterium]